MTVETFFDNFMRVIGMLVVAFVLIVLGVLIIARESEKPDPNTAARTVLAMRKAIEPQMGWVVAKDETIAINPGALRSWTLPADPKDLKVQLTVESQQSVTFGFATAESIAQLTPEDLSSTKPFFEPVAPCANFGILKVTTNCEVPRKVAVSFVIKDDRGAGSAARAAIGFFARSPQMVSNATTPNTVRIVWRVWGCIANCS